MSTTTFDTAKPKNSKKVSLLSAVALCATAMVGSGWLFSAQLNAQLAGNYAFLAWLLAGGLVMAVGLCLSQVVAVYPVRGATTRASALSHNPIFGMPFAFANWFGLAITVPTEAQATTQYLAAALKNSNLMTDNKLTIYGKLLALAILFIYLLINYYGIKALSKINNVITVLKIFAPLFTIVIFLIAHFDNTNFSLATNSVYSVASAITAIVSAGLIYSYNGFQLSVSFASEIDNPRRNVPLSIIISILLVMGIYLLLQLAFMGAVPHALLSDGWTSLNFHSPLINIAMLLGMNFLTVLLLADSIISPSGTGYAYLGGSSRMFYAMAIEGQMPSWTITRLHPIYNLCRRSLLINWALASLVLWNSDSWAALMVVVTGFHLIGYMAAPISMGAIKPTSRIWGAGVFALLGLLMSTVPTGDLWAMNLAMSGLMLVYAGLQWHKKLAIHTLLSFTTPVIIYLWAIYWFAQPLEVVSLSLVFYWLVTNPNYVALCNQYKSANAAFASYGGE